MDVANFSELLPLGGAGVLLIYLLRILISERRYWVQERDRLVRKNDEQRDHYERELLAKEEYWRKRLAESDRRFYGIGERRDDN